MTEEEARIIAEPVIKQIVNCMADGDYDRITEFAAFSEGFTPKLFQEVAEGYLEDNGFPHYDAYGVPNLFQPQYDKSLYKQLNVYVYNNGSGFGAEYDLTTDGELNDLTLMVEFRYDEDQKLQPFIDDLHVL